MKVIAFPIVGLNERLGLGVAPNSPTRLADTALQRVLIHWCLLPEAVEQFVFGHHPMAMSQEIGKHGIDMPLERYRVARTVQRLMDSV
jgi:hypothetical protein